MQLGELRTLSNQRWQHIAHTPCFRQYTKCKGAETQLYSQLARLTTKNSQRKTIVCVRIYSYIEFYLEIFLRLSMFCKELEIAIASFCFILIYILHIIYCYVSYTVSVALQSRKHASLVICVRKNTHPQGCVCGKHFTRGNTLLGETRIPVTPDAYDLQDQLRSIPTENICETTSVHNA